MKDTRKKVWDALERCETVQEIIAETDIWYDTVMKRLKEFMADKSVVRVGRTESGAWIYKRTK